MRKSQPFPVRFDDSEVEAILALQEQTELSASEIIRRAVRLLYTENAARNDPGFLKSLRTKGGQTLASHALAASRAAKPVRKPKTVSEVQDHVVREIKSRKTQLS